MTIYEIKKIVN